MDGEVFELYSISDKKILRLRLSNNFLVLNVPELFLIAKQKARHALVWYSNQVFTKLSFFNYVNLSYLAKALCLMFCVDFMNGSVDLEQIFNSICSFR